MKKKKTALGRALERMAGDKNEVRTSVVLPLKLWLAVKFKATSERRDLRDLIIEGLELVLKKGGK